MSSTCWWWCLFLSSRQAVTSKRCQAARDTCKCGWWMQGREKPPIPYDLHNVWVWEVSQFPRQNDKEHTLLMSLGPLQSPWLSARCVVSLWTCSNFLMGVHGLYLPSLSYGMAMFTVVQEFKPNRGPIFTIYSHKNWAKSCSFLSLWCTLYWIINSFKSSQFAESLKPLCHIGEAVNNQHYGFVAMYLID